MATTTQASSSLASGLQRATQRGSACLRAVFVPALPAMLPRTASKASHKMGHRAHFRVHAVEEAPGSGLQPELRSAIETFVDENKVVLFMKGTKEMPMCGFSNTVVQILNSMNAPYVTVNILEDDLLRSGMKEFSQWPTFPQVYIGGEFYGGCDIMIAAYQSGELAETLEATLNG